MAFFFEQTYCRDVGRGADRSQIAAQGRVTTVRTGSMVAT